MLGVIYSYLFLSYTFFQILKSLKSEHALQNNGVPHLS